MDAEAHADTGKKAAFRLLGAHLTSKSLKINDILRQMSANPTPALTRLPSASLEVPFTALGTACAGLTHQLKSHCAPFCATLDTIIPLARWPPEAADLPCRRAIKTSLPKPALARIPQHQGRNSSNPLPTAPPGAACDPCHYHSACRRPGKTSRIPSRYVRDVLDAQGFLPPYLNSTRRNHGRP